MQDYISTTPSDFILIMESLRCVRTIVNLYHTLCFKTDTICINNPKQSPLSKYDLLKASLTESKEKKRNCVIDYDTYLQVNSIIIEFASFGGFIDPPPPLPPPTTTTTL